MRIIRKRDLEQTSFLPIDFSYDKVSKNSLNEFGHYKAEFSESSVACLFCPGKFCLRISLDEMIYKTPQNSYTDVCPTDAIKIKDKSVVIDNNCIGCGLCVFRCPYGCIKFNSEYFPEINGNNTLYEVVSSEEFSAYMEDVEIDVGVPRKDLNETIENIVSNLRSTDQNVFYPLVGSIFSILGFTTLVTRSGDTNNRLDAVIVHPESSIPIEIKSPTESQAVNVKSVRQALENKVILLSREYHPTQYGITSLAVGFDYPAPRSEVEELIDNIFSAYQIKIGMIDIRTLYQLVVEKTLFKKQIDFELIMELIGRLTLEL